MDTNQKTTQAIVSSRATPVANKKIEHFSLFDEDLNPIDLHPAKSTVETNSAIGTVAKTTTASEPRSGQLVAVKFVNGNSASSPTLAFDGGSAKPILLGGTAVTGAKLTVAANGVALFVYDGTSLHQVGVYS